MIFNFSLLKSDVKLIKERQNELLKNIGLVPQTWEKSMVARASIRKSKLSLGLGNLARKSFFKNEIVKTFE